ncbi:MAG: apolipoprotein N-acyltransferase [Opitutales bacterium]|nr:apolipoprotein N-acyltransferase [Opitutales bacterium]
MFLSFPGPDLSYLVWIAFVPLLISSTLLKRPKNAWLCSWASEALRWFLIIIWLRHVTWSGTILIAVVMGLWQSVWFVLFRRCLRDLLGESRLRAWSVILLLSICWVGVEVVRTHPFGVPGANLALSQWLNSEILKICSFVGGAGLSGIIIAANLCFLRLGSLLYLSRSRGAVLKSLTEGVSVVSVLVGLLFISNWYVKEGTSGEMVEMEVAVVQTFQPPYRYWTTERTTFVINNLVDLSDQSRDLEYDLMMWPEGALPYSLAEGSSMNDLISFVVTKKIKRPLFLGNHIEADGKAYNGVAYFDENGVWDGSFYAKQALVPFGEYIPFRNLFPGIETIVPIPIDFQRGGESRVFEFEIGGTSIRIGSLICYEDCFPYLARKSVEQDADILFVHVYNGWYGKEFGASFHAAHSVLRALENGIPILRCGSSGGSCFISATGEIDKAYRDDRRTTENTAIRVLPVKLPLNSTRTFYSKWGSWIDGFWVGASLVILLGSLFKLRINSDRG